MYRTGHVGVALFLYTPLGVAVALAGYEPVAVLGAVVAASLSTVPDFDHQVPTIDHRGPTHTLAFAVLVGVALAGVTATVIGTSSPAADVGVVAFAFVVGTLAIVSHLLADVITPMGIR
ncbi:MAG: metal-dependent hydrolase, partial [Halolamina sp.]